MGCSKWGGGGGEPWISAMPSSPVLAGCLAVSGSSPGLVVSGGIAVAGRVSFLLLQDLHRPFASGDDRKLSVRRGCALQDLWELPGAWWADLFPIPRMDPCQIWNFLFGFSPDVSLFKLCPEHSN